MLESLFNKVAGFKVCNFIKKRLKHRCFPKKFAKFLRTSIFEEHLETTAFRYKSKVVMKCKTFSELKVPEFFKRLRITTQKNEIFFQGIVLVNLDKSAVFY